MQLWILKLYENSLSISFLANIGDPVQVCVPEDESRKL